MSGQALIWLVRGVPILGAGGCFWASAIADGARPLLSAVLQVFAALLIGGLTLTEVQRWVHLRDDDE